MIPSNNHPQICSTSVLRCDGFGYLIFRAPIKENPLLSKTAHPELNHSLCYLLDLIEVGSTCTKGSSFAQINHTLLAMAYLISCLQMMAKRRTGTNCSRRCDWLSQYDARCTSSHSPFQMELEFLNLRSSCMCDKKVRD